MSELDFENFFFNLPIYKQIKITQENLRDFETLLNLGRSYDETQIEGYNPFRKVNSTFTGYGNVSDSFKTYGGTDTISIKCKRYDDVLHYLVTYDRKTLIFMKVGQYPSLADFHLHDLKKYEKVLSKEKLKEFSKAIGLVANGVGIGSFVYLRRIFEDLIWGTFEIHKGELSKIESDFNRLRMDEKIEFLKAFLPSFLVENKALYSILSVGIHKLSEEDCLAYFPVVKLGIENILDEKVELFNKKAKAELGKKQILDLANKLKKEK